jgi:N-acetylmuramoyl-L-alanine amidase
MGLVDDFLAKVGALTGGTPAKPAAPVRTATDGVTVSIARDGAPAPASGLAAGHMLEVHAVLDEQRTATLLPNPRILVELVEEDVLGDDIVTTLVGTGATAPSTGTSVTCTVSTATAVPGQGVDWQVEQHKRTTASYEQTLLVVLEGPPGGPDALRRAHVFGWLRPEQVETGTSEYHAVIDVNGTARAASSRVDISNAVPGVAVRVTGALADADVPTTPTFGLLPDVAVTLRGRRAVSGADGRFSIDARLPVGTETLRIARPGVTPLELIVDVALAADGKATATLKQGATVLATATTPAAATATSLLGLDLTATLQLTVHKLRGTVLWPDSRRTAANAFRRTPLAERRVHVLPLPAGADPAAARPTKTRDWEGLKARADVLRSARPGAQPLAARTDANGRFEVRYVDLTAGNAFLLWVERFDGDQADTVSEAPDHVVRTREVTLRHIGAAPAGAVPTDAELGVSGNAGTTHTRTRKLIDHRTLVGDELVRGGVEIVRVVDQGGLLIRGESFGDIAVPASRIVDNLDLYALPVVPLAEAEGDRGRAARRAAEALATSCATFLPLGHDRGAVRTALDTRRLAQAAGLATDPDWTADETTPATRTVALLEWTFVSHPDVAGGPAAASWRVDAVTLADRSFAKLVGGRVISARSLDTHAIVPLFDAVVPRVAGGRTRRIYVAPGHGLWPHGAKAAPGAQADASHSNAAADWRSNRGGWAGDAGEDETDALWGRAVKQLLERAGATVHTCRELDRLTEPGVYEHAAGQFTPEPAATFPRLWQQNPLYAFARRPGPNGAALAALWDSPNAPTIETKDDDGINVRHAHIRRLAAQGQLDLVIAVHTNGSAGARGTMVEYLNAHPANAANVDGNQAGHDLASAAFNQLDDRCHLPRYGAGVYTMADLMPKEATGDLVNTFEHWSLKAQPAPTRDRFSTKPVLQAGQNFNALYETHPYPDAAPTPAGGTVLRTPVALIELGSHDQLVDAAALARAWFRQRAAESVALAVDEQLRAHPAIVSRLDVKRVLERFFGATPAVVNLSADAAAASATPLNLQQALEGVALGPPAQGAAPPPPIQPTLGAVVQAARDAAAAFTRRALVDGMRDVVAGPAGWQTGDAADIATWVEGPMTGDTHARPGETPTREEAGVLACRAVGLEPASLKTATAQPVGSPLIAGPATSDGALFPKAEALHLNARLTTLRPREVHRVTSVALTDGTRTARDDPRGSGRYALYRGTALTIVVRTGGAAWKTVNHTAADKRLGDAELRLTFGGRKAVVPVLVREPTLVASSTWILDFPPTAAAEDLRVELWLRHRTEGWQLVDGVQSVALRVLAAPPP